MRKIEEKMLAALNAHKNWAENNTRVEFKNGCTFLYLHHNLIYLQLEDGRKFCSLQGWDTVTTRSRLRALGVPLVSNAGRRYINGVEIPTDRKMYEFN